MRKCFALTLATVSVSAVMVSAIPSGASPSDPVVPKVCADLPVMLLNSANALSAANGTLNTANVDLTNKRNLLNTAVAEWVTAFANHLVELDKVDGNPAATKALLDAAAAKVTQRVGPWGQAKLAQWDAQHKADIATIALLINTTLDGQLPCS